MNDRVQTPNPDSWRSGRRSWKRWIRRGILALVLVGFLVSLGWAPLAVVWVRLGLAVGPAHADRVAVAGWAQMQIEGLQWTNRSLRLQIQRLRIPTPLVWLWERAWNKPDSQAAVEGKGWRVRLIHPSSPKPLRPRRTPWQKIERWIRRLYRFGCWLPPIHFQEGQIVFSNGVKVLVPECWWIRGWLWGGWVWEGEKNRPLGMDLQVLGAREARISVRWKQGEGTMWAMFRDGGWRLDGVVWTGPGSSLRFRWSGRLAERWPRRGRVWAEDWRVPLEWVKGRIGKRFRLRNSRIWLCGEWVDGKWNLAGKATVETKVMQRWIQSAVWAAVHGSEQRIGVDRFCWLTDPAWLGLETVPSSQGLAGDRKGLRGRLELAGWVQPEDLPKSISFPEPIALHGIVRGTGRSWIPQVEWAVAGKMEWKEPVVPIRIWNVHGQGNLLWPQLEIRQLAATAPKARAGLQGKVQLQGPVLTTLLFTGAVERVRLPPRWKLAGIRWGLRLQGPMTRPTLNGQMEVQQAAVPWVKPCRVRLTCECPAHSSLLVGFFMSWPRARLRWMALIPRTFRFPLVAEIKTFEVQRDSQNLLTLEQPVQIRLDRPSSLQGDRPGICLEVDPALALCGTAGRIRLRCHHLFTRNGSVELIMQGIRVQDWSDFVRPSLLPVELRTLWAKASWTNGPAQGEARWDLILPARKQVPELEWIGIARVESATNQIFHCTLQAKGERFASGAISLPMQVRLDRFPPVLRRPLDTALQGTVRVKLPSAWAVSWPIRPESFQLQAQLQGTWSQPVLQVQVQTGRWKGTGIGIHSNWIQKIHSVKIEARLTPQQIRFSPIRVEVGTVPVQASFQTPVRPWLAVLRKEGSWKEALSKVQARLDLPRITGTVFQRWFPDRFGPSGWVEAHVALEPGFRPTGTIQFSGLRYQVRPDQSPLQDLKGRIVLKDRMIQVESIHARWAGGTLEAKGKIDLQEGQWGPIEFSVWGTNLAVVRKPEVLIRSDAQLQIRGQLPDQIRVLGTIRLGQSLVFRDLQSLIQPDVRHPETRPPYFSIKQPPFRDWKLDIQIEGSRCLRVVTPVFEGVLSAGLHLQGTLGSPWMTGEITVEKGTVLFPFGRLAVIGGHVTFSEEDPYNPIFSIQAMGRNYGYQVELHLGGTLKEPALTFHSVPPLDTREILLMLTSGRIPSGAFAYTTQSRMQKLGFFLGKQLLSPLLGGTGEDRLQLRIGEEVSEQGSLTYTIEYRLSRRWWIFGSKNRFDDLIGGIKWRVYER